MTIYAFEDTSPQIDPAAWVAPDANIIGNVSLGAGASVWFGATLRGDNDPIVVGTGSNVQEGCIFHTDPGFPLIIGQACTVGHRAILHGCTLEDHVLIGMGAIVMNGAVIGAGSLVGAGALVTERTVIPPNSLVLGQPAKVVKTVDFTAQNQAAAEQYQQKLRRFQAGLTRVDT